ncbi:MAG: outer membrane beta-barrel protein [Bacteroidales bacterium]
MKTFTLTIVMLLAGFTFAKAQKLVVITDDSTKIQNSAKIVAYSQTFSDGDTTVVRIGRFSVQVSNKYSKSDGEASRTIVRFDRERRNSDKFRGHWASVQLGFNGFANADYSMYAAVPKGVPSDFMSLNQAASWEVNLNPLEWNISLSRNKKFGIVTGAGISWNNYKFDNSVTIDKNDDGIIYPIDIEENNYRKSKLMLTYLAVPLLFEYQFPINSGKSYLFVNAGVVGEFNLGSRTKVKNDNDKLKDRGSFNIEPFKCSAMVQIGGNDFAVYAKYGLTRVFKSGQGPELTPFSIGISIGNLW